MEIALACIFGLLGIAVGSFLNVCIDRLPAGRSLLRPPSYCDACQHRLSPLDLVPVFSYLLLRRRCRYCQETIPHRVFWVEFTSGFLFAFLYWHYGLTAELAIITFYCYLFILLGVIDLERKVILNKIVYPAAVVALVAGAFLSPPGFINLTWSAPLSGILNSIIGGAIGFIFLLLPALITPGGMGFGDVKMSALIGIITGSRLVLVALFIAVLFGGIVSVFLLLSKRKTLKELIPFGPFLSIAAMVTLLWGNEILDWYLTLF